MSQQQDKEDMRNQANHLWQYRLHEDDALADRQNFFLIAESMLVVAYAGLLSSSQSGTSIIGQQEKVILVARILAFVGLLLTLVWIYVNRRQSYVIRHLREISLKMLPEYKEIYESRGKPRISTNWLMTYFVPGLVGVMWAVFTLLV